MAAAVENRPDPWRVDIQRGWAEARTWPIRPDSEWRAERYVTKEFQSRAVDWQDRMKFQFQREVERKGFTLAGEVRLWHQPWDDCEIAQRLPDHHFGADRYRMTGEFIPNGENRG